MKQAMRIWTVVILGAALCAGCRKDNSDASSQDRPEMLLYCGAGLRPPVEVLIAEFSVAENVTIAVDYAGSEVLLSKMKLSGQGDLYLPGDERYVDLAAGQNLVAARRNVCYFVPTILVRKGNPKRVRGLTDLTREDVRVGLGDPRACSIGTVSRELLQNGGMGPDEIGRLTQFQAATVNELAVHVQTGSLDAVIVWDAVAKQYAQHTTEVSIPIEHNVIAAVDMAILTYSQQFDLADRFAQFAGSERGRAIFREHGYQVDNPATQPGGGS